MSRAANSEVSLGYSVYNRTLGLSSGRALRRRKTYPHFDDVLNRTRVNAECLVKILGWNLTNDYRYFRVSDFFIPVRGYGSTEILDRIRVEIEEISMLVDESKSRIVFHTTNVPFASGTDDVFRQRATDLNTFAELLDQFGSKYDDGWIECHLGPRETFDSIDDDTYSVIERRVESLSPHVRSRLTFENDEQWSVGEVHVLCERLAVPFTYDIMHHRLFYERVAVLSGMNIPFTFDGVRQAVEWCRLSWSRRQQEWASTHVSSQAPDKVAGAHADVIDYVDYAMLRRALYLVGGAYYINLESKYLDQSIQYIQTKIAAHRPRWATINNAGVRV